MGDPSDIATLQARVAEMRKLGVTRWGDIELGPDPAQPEADQSDAKPESPDQRVRRERAERERLMMQSSGGLVPRIDPG